MREILRSKDKKVVDTGLVRLVDNSKYLPLYEEAARITGFSVAVLAKAGEKLLKPNGAISTIEQDKVAIAIKKPDGPWKNFNDYWGTLDALFIMKSSEIR